MALPSSTQCALCIGEHGPCGIVELVFEFTGELLDGVFGRDEADSRSVLIDNDGHLAAPLLEFLQQSERGLCLRHHEHLAHHLAQAEFHERKTQLRTPRSVGRGVC